MQYRINLCWPSTNAICSVTMNLTSGLQPGPGPGLHMDQWFNSLLILQKYINIKILLKYLNTTKISKLYLLILHFISR